MLCGGCVQGPSFSMAVDDESSSFWKKAYSFPLQLEENIGGKSSLLVSGYAWEYHDVLHDEDERDDSLELGFGPYFE